MKKGISKTLAVKISNWMAKHHWNCEATVKLLSRSLDEKLPFMERIKMKTHLMMCKWCPQYFEQINFLRAALRGQDDKITGDAGNENKLSPEAKERMKQAIRSAEKS